MNFEKWMIASGMACVGIVALWLAGDIGGEALKSWIEVIYSDVTGKAQESTTPEAMRQDLH